MWLCLACTLYALQSEKYSAKRGNTLAEHLLEFIKGNALRTIMCTTAAFRQF